ncbi:MAG: hypothetical protein GX574_11990 [Lentisphaerae bacterium]|nr:hypothetical protein [Lentisphaerota bacterium]OQC12926.1 MAG: Carbohydrate binding domain protein [Lentisphaerae bacterium ADurb.Bin082]
MKKLFLLVALLACAGASAQDVNLLKNANFQEMGPNGFPVHWRSASPDTQLKAADDSITLFATDDKAATITQALSLESDVPHVFSYQIKADAPTEAQAYIETVVTLPDGKKKWVNSGAKRFNVETSWNEYKVTFSIPDNPSSCYLALRSVSGTPVTFKNVNIRAARIRKQWGGYWNLEGLADSPDNGLLVPGGKEAQLLKLPVEPGKTYRISYTAQGMGATGQDYPFHEITSLVTPKVTGAYSFNDVTNSPQPKNHTFTVPKDADFKTVNIAFTPKTAGKVLFTDFTFQEVIPDATAEWQFHLTEPFYRDTIYASQDTGRVAGELIADPTAVKAKVTIDGLGSTEITLTQGQGSFAFKAEQLAIGRYPVTCNVYDAKGAVLKQFTLTLAKVPANSVEVIAKPNGYFYINGKPFFPVTQWNIAFSSPEVYYYSAKNGINSCFYSVGNNKEKVMADLDKAHTYGLKLILPTGVAGSNAPEIMARYRERITKTFTPEIRNHPAVLGYFLVDEPLWGGRPSEPIRASYEFFKEFDPYHPCWINAAPRNENPELRPYAAACDIWGADIYPYPYPNTHSGIDDKGLTSVGKYCLRMSETTYGRKPTWMALQGFAWASLNRETPVEKHQYPDDTVMRFMAMDAMLNKCTGYGLWGTQYIRTPSFYDTIHKTTSELHKLSRLFVDGAQQEDISTDNQDVRVAVIKHQAETYLFILNLTDQPTEAHFNAGVGQRKLTVFADNSALQPANGQLTLPLEPFQVIVCGTAALPPPIYELPKANQEFDQLGNPFPGLIEAEAEKYRNTKFYRGDASWIWDKALVKAAGSLCLIAKTFEVKTPGKKAFLKIAVDDFSKIYVNGKLVGETDAWSLMKKIDITAALTPGENIIMVRAEDSGSLPCGLLAELEIDEKTVLKSDGSWLAKPIQAKDPMPEANKNSLSTFQPVIVITPYGGGAWGTRVVAQQ